MKVEIIETLKPTWEHKIWESGHGRYVGTAHFRVQSDEPIFGSVQEEGGRRVSRKGTPLYDTLDAVFHGRVGGHPFEITDVVSETEFTASFRLGYSSHPPAQPSASLCSSCPDKDNCEEYEGPEDEEEEDYEDEEEEDEEDEEDYEEDEEDS